MAPGATFMKEPGPKPRVPLLSHVKWEHCAAGVCGGVSSTLVLHPLDLIKIRFQVNEGATVAVNASRPQYRGVIDALTTISKKEGLKGLYQGVTPNVWGAGASWGLYFLFYNSIKNFMLESERAPVLGVQQHMIAAAEAGVFTLMLTNPIWVAKTRLCLQYDANVASTASHHVTRYKGMTDCLLKISREEGIKGLYKGFIPGVVGVSHGMLQFVAYEELKKSYNSYRQLPLDTKLSSFEYIIAAAMSKIFAASATYPYQVVRSRLQDQHRHYNGIADVLKQLWRYEGMRGFFKGLTPYLLHVTPNICMVFLVYEKFTAYFGAKNDENRRVQTRMDIKNSQMIDQQVVAPIDVKIIAPAVTETDDTMDEYMRTYCEDEFS